MPIRGLVTNSINASTQQMQDIPNPYPSDSSRKNRRKVQVKLSTPNNCQLAQLQSPSLKPPVVQLVPFRDYKIRRLSHNTPNLATMAFSTHFFLLCSLLFFIISPSIAQTSFRPNALVLPVSKDPSSLQYITKFNQRTPLVPINLTLDLGGRFTWVDCEQGYVSSTYKPVRCRSAQCSLTGSRFCNPNCYSSPKPGCYNNTCQVFFDNPIIQFGTGGELALDVVSVHSTDGLKPTRVVSVPSLLFTCGRTFLLESLANGVKGIAGLGRTKMSLPSQFSAALSFDRKFAVCLSSSTRANGVVFFGDGPYVMLPNIDVSKNLIYTPLILNPVRTAPGTFQDEPSADYFIGVKSIKINGKVVKLNTTLLSISKEGFGGTKISSVNPYTVMETTIYNAVINAFVREVSSVSRVAAVAPFGACFNAKEIGSTRVGPAVPDIDLVLQSESVYWRIFGANSMVEVSSDVLCLGFVDGGVDPRTSIVIGGHQIEDNLLQFDLATSRLGFSSSLLFRQTTCANFNFTSKI
ncbi:probable aspartic proteinase GIP2 [Tripterygium wilfordii]|uniref:probable aspartic proteinase GIP2 n=1 Tax=Tripterygium wilfordii TaxID=458696 RepID=UPI0018F838A1|nr:probable aspartic proteinase GIP2 [Tripterygium wilfordii]